MRTARANHVTREYGVKNDYIFGIPDPDLPIHYTASIVLRRRLGLRVVYSRAVQCYSRFRVKKIQSVEWGRKWWFLGKWGCKP